MATVDASRHALIQKRKNDKEQERSIERTYADMMILRNQEIDHIEAKEREENRQRMEQLKEYQLKQIQDRRNLAEKEYKGEMDDM